MPSPKKPTSRQLVEEAISLLRAGTPARPDLADAVEDLAQQRFRGWTGAGGTVMAFRADRAMLAAVGEGRLSQVAVAGCIRFLDGQLEPERTTRGAAGEKKQTSVRIPADLLARVDARCAEVTPSLGWTVRPVNVVVAALREDASTPRE